jgi:exodeoxyribonuclease VII small subunit
MKERRREAGGMTKEKTNFGEKLESVDGILRQLEEGKLSLDEALQVFERGISLVREAREFLEKAEQKVTLLTQEGKEVPFARTAEIKAAEMKKTEKKRDEIELI